MHVDQFDEITGLGPVSNANKLQRGTHVPGKLLRIQRMDTLWSKYVQAKQKWSEKC
jgi:hypothetical protein